MYFSAIQPASHLVPSSAVSGDVTWCLPEESDRGAYPAWTYAQGTQPTHVCGLRTGKAARGQHRQRAGMAQQPAVLHDVCAHGSVSDSFKTDLCGPAGTPVIDASLGTPPCPPS